MARLAMAWAIRNAPRRFTSNNPSHWASESSRKATFCAVPALLIRTSIDENLRSVAASRSSTPSLVEMSARWLPTRSNRAVSAWWAVSSFWALVPFSMTQAPESRKASAVARPNPPELPVTTTTLPVKSMCIVSRPFPGRSAITARGSARA